jgi:hypothetical protein
MPVRHPSVRLLVFVAAVSGLYDVLLGITMLAGRGWLQSAFALPPPAPPIHADLNGLFLIAVGVGYVWPYRDPDRYRGYLWVMGPLLKGFGSLLFVADHFLRGSPDVFLLFALTDGVLALWALWALLRTQARTRD